MESTKSVHNKLNLPSAIAFLLKVLSNITIEPSLFLINFGDVLDDISFTQMVLFKSCTVDFGFNETVCNDLVDYEDANKIVQDEAASFSVYQTLVATIFPIFFSFYLGAWCDLFGRKLLFKVYLTARCLDQMVVLICAIFINSPKEYLLLARIPSSLAGGKSVFGLVTYAFIADVSSPDTRSFRFGMIFFISILASTFAPSVGAYLLSSGGYVCVFSVSLLLTILAALFLIIRIRNFNWQSEKQNVRSILICSQPIVSKSFQHL